MTTTMHTADLLTLMQWLSPAYPVGAFAYSHGLETEISAGRLRSAAALEAWLSDVLEHGGGAADAVLLTAAYDADEADLETIDAEARAFAGSSERLRETVDQGAAFAATTRAVWGLDLPDMAYPVAVGRAGQLKGMARQTVCAAYLHGFVANLVSAAVRLVPLGQTEGQAVLAGLAPLCEEIAQRAEGKTCDDLVSQAFLSDIAAMQHEDLDVRIFRT